MVVPLIDGDTTLTSIFHFIQDTGILEGALFQLSRLFLKFLWFLCQPPPPICRSDGHECQTYLSYVSNDESVMSLFLCHLA